MSAETTPGSSASAATPKTRVASQQAEEHPSPSTPQPHTPPPDSNATLHKQIADDIDFLELFINNRLRTYTFGDSLAFVQDPRGQAAFTSVDIDDTTADDHYRHALNPRERCNDKFLEQERWLLTVYQEVDAISRMGVAPVQKKVAQVRALLRQEWARMQLQKGREWDRQRRSMRTAERLGASYLNSGMEFVYILRERL